MLSSFQNGLSEAVGREFMAEFGGIIKDCEVAFPPNQDSEDYGTFGPATKSVSLQRHGNGFGFTLRHFVIYPPDLVHTSNEASRSNGLDKPKQNAEEGDAQKTEPVDVVFIRQVAPSSPADKAGLSTGDQIISVNKDSVIGKSYTQVIQLIQDSQDLLELEIVPKEDCMLQLVTPSLTDMQGDRPPSPSSVTRLSYNLQESQNSPLRMMSSVTVTPSSPGSSNPPLRTSSVHLKLADNGSSNSPDHRSNSSLPSVSFMRNSVDRAAQENRGFVITGISHTLDTNSNHLPIKSNLVGACSLHAAPSKMNGSYFVAATDSTGRARALHFEKGSATGSALSVVDDARGRSKSLTTEHIGLTQHDKKLTFPIRDQSNNLGPVEFRSNSAATSIIPPFTLSAPRTYSSDGLSTSYLSTNSDSGGRQPVASEADFDKSRTTPGDSMTHLTRAAVHEDQDRQEGLKSSTVSETLLESHPDEQAGHSKLNGDRSLSLVSSPAVLYDSLQPANGAHQSDNSNEPLAFSSQMSVFPNKPSYEEVIFSQSDPGEINIGKKPRRISYLMATARGGGRNVSNQTARCPSSRGSQRSFAVPLTTSSSNLQPMMVHVSSGMELCEDTSVTSENSCPAQEPQGDSEGLQDSSIQRGDTDVHSRSMNRRTSYVIATSSPTSPRHVDSLAAMEEENEEVFEEEKEGVPGLSEVSKEGMLFRKVAIVDGGKRSSARSWKPVNAVLKGHVLYLQKDKTNFHQGESSSDEQPVSIKSCIVDIAYDYTKRKNVFRVTTFNGSEFLFQAEDHCSMMSWISAIQANNNPDEDENGVTSQSVIIRRIRNVEHEAAGMTAQAPTLKVSPATNTKIPNITGGITNLKKSLSFKNITVGPKDKGEGVKNHWHKAIRRKKKTPETGINSYPQGHSVGVPLELCPVGSYKFVPLIVEHCSEVVEHKGLDTIGVYRVPGNSASVTAMQEEINAKGAENINFEDEKWNDVNNMTSLLKQFLRKLPEGLLTAELYYSFMDANKKEDPVERMLALKSLVQDLPEHNFETLKLLMMHLKRIAENSEKNKMDARNLAIVFGPTLVRTGEDTMMTLVRDMSDQCRIVESLLLHCDWFFEDSEEGDDSSPKPPPVAELPQEHMLSQTVFSTLGQAAVNFGDGGCFKPNKGGMSVQFPKLPVKRKSDPTHVSSPETSMTSEGPGSGGSSPSVERAPTAPFSTSDSSRSNSPTQDKSVSRTALKRSGDLSPVGAPVHLTLLEMMDSARPRGTASLKAYSFSLPPPPSYRPQNQKTSPVEQISPTDGSVTFGLSSGEDENAVKPVEEPKEAEVSPTSVWPKIETLSEGTKLRLLRLNLLQRANEKKRLQKEKELGIAQVESRSESSSGDLSPEAHRANRKLSDACESGGSASTSRSSSAPSSTSLDSLQFPGADREGYRNYVQSSTARNLPWTTGGCKSSSQPHQQSTSYSEEPPPRSFETCVVIPRGCGIVSSNVESYSRPYGPDVQMRHAEGRRASFDSESTESSSEDEEEGECALSLSKTFDEKLKILLDLDYKFSSEGRRRNSIKEQEDEVSSVSSEPQPRLYAEQDADTQTGASNRRASYQPKGGFLISDLQDAMPGDDIVVKTSLGDDASTSLSSLTSSASRKSSLSQELHTCETGVRMDSLDPGAGTAVVVPTMTEVEEESEVGMSAAQPCGYKVEESEAVLTEVKLEKRLPPRRSVPSAAEIKITVDRNKQRNALNSSRSIGSVRTATPVALKEFNFKEVAMKKNIGSPRRTSSEAQMRSSPEQNTHPKQPLRSATSAPASSLRPMNMSLSSSHKYDSGALGHDAGRPLPIIAKSRAVPRAGYRDSGARIRLLSQKAASRELLPSKARETDHSRSKVVPTEKLEKNAQHIAELLEEMHSERHLKMNRQRSDISGDAQKAAAQRAAWRRRRRSMGDDEAVVMATRLGVSTNTVVMETPRNTGRQQLEARSSTGYSAREEARRRDYQRRPPRTANTPWK